MQRKSYLNRYSNAIALIAVGLTLNLTGQFSFAGTTQNAPPIAPATVGAASRNGNRPACYVQTTAGKLIDLSKKCGFIKPAVCATSLGSASRDAVLADFCRKNQRCVLTNTCNAMPRGIKAPPSGTPMGFLGMPRITA